MSRWYVQEPDGSETTARPPRGRGRGQSPSWDREAWTDLAEFLATYALLYGAFFLAAWLLLPRSRTLLDVIFGLLAVLAGIDSVRRAREMARFRGNLRRLHVANFDAFLAEMRGKGEANTGRRTDGEV